MLRGVRIPALMSKNLVETCCRIRDSHLSQCDYQVDPSNLGGELVAAAADLQQLGSGQDSEDFSMR